MERVGFLLKVKEKFINEYKEHHLDVWPKMKSALTKHGWKNYSLFMRSDGLMFGYFEATKSFSASLKGMSNEEINKEAAIYLNRLSDLMFILARVINNRKKIPDIIWKS